MESGNNQTVLLARCALLLLALLSTQCVDDNLEKLAKKNPASSTTTSATDSSDSVSTASGSSSASSSSSSTVSFSMDIQPILSKYACANCHGTFYYNYPGVHSLAVSGMLYGTMSWSPGYRRMPPGQKPTAPELSLIKQWADLGAPNN